MTSASLAKIVRLTCVQCGAHYKEGEQPYTCPACGIEGILDVEYDYDVARRGMAERGIGKTPADRLGSIWRYMDLLPISGAAGLPRLQVGGTPVVDAPRLAAKAGVASLVLKDDGRLPTGSFKDRASAIGTTKARELGFKRIACSSTGNAASSLAGFAADAGLEAFIFVPAHAPPAKVAQLRAFGATVLLVEGSYDQAYYLCEDACRAYGWYDRNCAVNPYLVEGKKTCGLEIGEQFAQDPPDWVVVALGDGCTTAGIWKGMREMHALGVLPRLPRMLSVQAEGAAPLAKAWKAKNYGDAASYEKTRADTAADSIAVGEPRNWRKSLRAVKASEGAIVAVPDDAILEAAKDIAAATGVFAEPTASATLAGLLRARAEGIVGAKDRILMVVTGNGLKDIAGASAKAPPAHRIGVSLDDVQRVLAEQRRP
ncbi:MAG TPA: threonine synthase [Polyangiaceae bacterium]|jgi:threonine synthase